MTRPVIAIVTGFTKCNELVERSFAPLASLKQAGIIDRIVYVTWNKPEIDAFVAPAASMTEVDVLRVPQPAVTGTATRRGVAYQIHNLKAALAAVREDDALIVKLRPDFIAREPFLKAKIENFDTLCAPSTLSRDFGVTMPPSPFAAKLWIPWADANLPLHYEDSAFIGLKCDVAKLADIRGLAYLDSDLLAHEAYAWFAHVARYATVFLDDYPLFAQYLEHFHCFMNDPRYRLTAMPAAIEQSFFWKLVVANAWILAISFHVDCGEDGDLSFYTNASNKNADWSRFGGLRNHPPYNAASAWRHAQMPGGMLPCVGRVHARLVDDSWQHALFTSPTLRDLTPDNIRGALRQIADYDGESVKVTEQGFYRVLEDGYRGYFEAPVAVAQ